MNLVWVMVVVADADDAVLVVRLPFSSYRIVTFPPSTDQPS